MIPRKEDKERSHYKNGKYADWLESIQQESWQLELLISGFVIFGLFASRPYLFGLTDMLIKSDDQTIFVGGLISSSLPLAWIIFVSNLILHVFIRGLWIGSIGLRYVSGDIEYDKLNYSDAFTSYYQNKHGSFDNFIEQLEKISSVIFSITFLIFFILLSSLIYLGINFLISDLALHPSASLPVLVIGLVLLTILFFSGLLVIIDFLTFGTLKKIKNKIFSKIYLKLNILISFITLSFVWRPMLLNILDNKFSRMMFLISIPYSLVISFIIPTAFFNSSAYYPDFKMQSDYESVIASQSYNYLFYKDELIHHLEENKSIELPLIQLESKNITGDILEVFVKAHKFDDILLEDAGTLISPLYSKGLQSKLFSSLGNGNMSTSEAPSGTNDVLEDKATNKSKSDIRYTNNIRLIKSKITELFDFYVNEKLVDKQFINCDFYTHPISKTRGLWCVVQLDSLSTGRHELGFKRLICNDFIEKSKEHKEFSIPFIYEE